MKVNLPLESFFDSPQLSVSYNVQIVRTAKESLFCMFFKELFVIEYLCDQQKCLQ